jgi:hypothetical protein
VACIYNQDCASDIEIFISICMTNTNFEFELTDDFIGIFDNAFPPELCDKFLNYYQELDNVGLARSRESNNPKALRHHVEDSAFDLITGPFHNGEVSINYVNHDFVACFWAFCYPEYAKKYSIMKDLGEHQISDMKVQKTSPGQGYHVWHAEASNRQNCNRVFAFMLYLNDVEDGGETEFLYLKKRFKPQKNRLLMWPAGFTHTHRGNPPLSGDKYIITGWIEF